MTTAMSWAADRAGFLLFTLCVSFAPIMFGAIDPVVAGVIGLLLTACLFLAALSPEPRNGTAGLLLSVFLVSSLIIVWTVAQVMSWRLAPAANPALAAAGRLVADDAGQSSAVRYSMLLSAGYILIPLVAFACALQFIRDDARYMRFANTVLVVNLVVAAACMVQFVVAPKTLLWLDKKHYVDAFTGTFVNPNTAATHFGVLLVLALGLGLRRLQRANLYTYFWGGMQSPGEIRHIRFLSAYAAATLVMLLALLLTKSRAGILASLAGTACLIGAFVYTAVRRRMSFSRAAGITGLSVLGVIAIFLTFGERFLLRLEMQGLVEPGRLCAYRSTWAAIRDNPWWGTGPGTFQDIFPAYRSPECGLDGHWDMAHSVFLEGWMAFGIAFGVCTLLFYYQLLRTYGHGLRHRRRYRFVPMSCLGILVILTLHSLVDFSLQIPGFATTAAAILGGGAAVSLRSRQRRRESICPGS